MSTVRRCRQEDDLRLDTAEGISEQRDPPLLIKGDATTGEFLHRITTTDADFEDAPIDSNRELTTNRHS